MNKMSLKTKVITGLIAGGILISSTSLCFAAANSNTNTKANSIKTQTMEGRGHRGGNTEDKKAAMDTQLKAAVSANIITQEESTKITDFLTANTPAADKGSRDLFADLVSKGILTQVKADALKANFDTQRVAEMTQNLETDLKTFVTDKTITQDQADKVKATLIANMPKERPTADTAKTEPVNPLKVLVDNGTITQGQADKLSSVLHRGHRGRPNGNVTLPPQAAAPVTQ